MDIKAIETVYNGYRFRSRLEARWAVFFDAMGVEYQYEPEGYDLGEAGYYLPDFYLPDSELFIEIKPCEPSAIDIEKAEALHYMVNFPVCIFYKTPWDVRIYVVCHDVDWGGGGVYSREIQFEPALHIDSNRMLHVLTYDSKSERSLLNSDWGKATAVHSMEDMVEAKIKPGVNAHLIEDAAINAKQARFEYGETGMVL